MLRSHLWVIVITAIVGCSEAPKPGKETRTPESPVDQSVVVSKQSFESDDPYDIVYSNIIFINALLEKHFTADELSQDALRSYYVDYYLAEVNNGGFSQFVYNTGWKESTVRYVLEGLEAMGASQHLELFKKSAAIIDRIGPDDLDKYFDSEYFGENSERDLLNQFDDKFYDLKKRENLIQLNSAWLRSRPNLVVSTNDDMKAEVERRAQAVPDREARIAEGLANEPRFMKLIRALCAEAGHKFSHATIGDPTHNHNGRSILAWHFITDKGHHYMVDVEGKAIMFNGDSHEKLVEIEASDEYGSE
jgi:uncharacterized protein DUF4375